MEREAKRSAVSSAPLVLQAHGVSSVPRLARAEAEPLGREVDRGGRAARAVVIRRHGGAGGDEGGGLRGLPGAERDRHAHRLVARRTGRRRPRVVCRRERSKVNEKVGI